uniref:Protein kinase domain-containing protein n=1 Tax=Solanum lycopersicum TaxID=4081 RepID=A0A3Q7IH66_SOLLC
MMDKEEVGSSSKGTTDMENIAGITSKAKALSMKNRKPEKGDKWIIDSGSYGIAASRLKGYSLPNPKVSCFILQDKAGHTFFSTDLKSIYETTKNVTLDYCYKGKGLLMSADHIPHLTGYCDADWVVFPNTRRLVTCFFPDSLIIGNPKSGILSLGVLQRLSTGVCLGVLQNGVEIAVKKKDMTSHQEFTKFENEVKLIAKLQHRNLTKFLGYCINGAEKFLVYEFRSNNSLHKILEEGVQ